VSSWQGTRSYRRESIEAMKSVVVLYATREGHTRRIADAIGRGLVRYGLQTCIVDLGREGAPKDLDRHAAAVLASPVHMGRYASEAIAFAKHHRCELQGMTAAFVSVSLTEASVERSKSCARPEEHARYVAYVKRANQRFFEQTGWRPARVENVAGALAYTRYNFLIRFLMKLIASRTGGSTDTSRDHQYTDWAALDRFVAALAEDIVAGAVPSPGPVTLSRR
jgi:menaquinone-dependent protoporphyrinogen oxidase